jgi:ABC-type sugar transport system ATPase subunit
MLHRGQAPEVGSLWTPRTIASALGLVSEVDRDRGASVLASCSPISEVLLVADGILPARPGRVASEFEADDAVEEIMFEAFH